MSVVAVLTALLALMGAGQTKDTQERAVQCKDAERGIVYYRGRVWEYQRILDEPRLPTRRAEKKVSCAYKKWAANLWRTRAIKYRNVLARLDNAEDAICYVFGSYCSQALAVAYCESRFSRHAVNGQYLGLFQMGRSERRIFGHGETFLEQARAAYAYFISSGRDWSPWDCRTVL